jgi:hypothetical protein
MKKVPLYTLKVDEQFLINNIEMRVTGTKKIVKSGSYTYETIFCRQVGGNAFLDAPAGLMVTKID